MHKKEEREGKDWEMKWESVVRSERVGGTRIKINKKK